MGISSEGLCLGWSSLEGYIPFEHLVGLLGYPRKGIPGKVHVAVNIWFITLTNNPCLYFEHETEKGS